MRLPGHDRCSGPTHPALHHCPAYEQPAHTHQYRRLTIISTRDLSADGGRW